MNSCIPDADALNAHNAKAIQGMFERKEVLREGAIFFLMTICELGETDASRIVDSWRA